MASVREQPSSCNYPGGERYGGHLYTRCQYPHLNQKERLCHFCLSLIPGQKALPFLPESETLRSLPGHAHVHSTHRLETSLTQGFLIPSHVLSFSSISACTLTSLGLLPWDKAYLENLQLLRAWKYFLCDKLIYTLNPLSSENTAWKISILSMY